LNETQFYIYAIVVPVSTIVIVLIGVLLTNTNMNARVRALNASFAEMSGGFGAICAGSVNGSVGFANIDRGFTELKDLIQACSDWQDANFLRFEEKLLGKFAELDNRLSRIEHHLNLGPV